jgi:hypothetical protein
MAVNKQIEAAISQLMDMHEWLGQSFFITPAICQFVYHILIGVEVCMNGFLVNAWSPFCVRGQSNGHNFLPISS